MPPQSTAAAATRTNWQKWAREYWFLPPLLIFYGLIVVAGRDAALGADAGRYIDYAANLLHGYYSPPGPVDLANGPGYPLVLIPFVPASAWLAAGLLNAFLLGGAVVYFHATLRLYVAPRVALVGALALGVYVPALLWLPNLMSETLALFLAAGLAYHVCRLLGQPRFQWRHALAAAFYLGYLALTKFLFGYVMEACLVLAVAAALIFRSELPRRAGLICGLGLLVAAPYLIYTLSISGRLNYWGTTGGRSLYWMTTPYAEEYGDLFNPVDWEAHPEVEAHHGDFFEALKLPSMEKDDALKRQALKNMAARPLKFAQNWVANVGRIFFNYPYSYTEQKLSTYAYVLPGMLLVTLGLVATWLAMSHWHLMPPEVVAVVVFGLVSLGATSVLSAVGRMLIPLLPFFGLGIVVMLGRVLRLKPNPDRTQPVTPVA